MSEIVLTKIMAHSSETTVCKIFTQTESGIVWAVAEHGASPNYSTLTHEPHFQAGETHRTLCKNNSTFLQLYCKGNLMYL